jgi:hypothetical protein
VSVGAPVADAPRVPTLISSVHPQFTCSSKLGQLDQGAHGPLVRYREYCVRLRPRRAYGLT